MQITRLHISNFKSIKNMHLKNLESALILVGRNNTGKTAVMDAVRAMAGQYRIQPEDFQEDYANIEIAADLYCTEEDLIMFHTMGKVSGFRNYDRWLAEFKDRLPWQEAEDGGGGTISFTFVANREGKIRYEDQENRHNAYISEILPRIYYVDALRTIPSLAQELMLGEYEELVMLREDLCMFDKAKKCNQCFSCIGLINQKTPEQLNALETARLLDYKLVKLNLSEFMESMNEIYHGNGGEENIFFSLGRDMEQMLTVNAEFSYENQTRLRPISQIGKGMRSIYLLSLIETLIRGGKPVPGILLVEEPEMYLHPQLQKVSGDILYRLSQKNQVMFTTHSAQLLLNFSNRQIRQVVDGEDGWSAVRKNTNISAILDDLGYSAADMMNVDFVFIVEGKQDKNRLPLLLRKYYSEIFDEDGNLARISIVTTNSCTNIRTYANLKYINQLYLKDNFLMIRDGDGKNRRQLTQELCNYYEQSGERDIDTLPRVTEKNVLVLRYYSFENYFLNPEIMATLGVIEEPEDFYRIFLAKWKSYLSQIRSGKRLQEVIGHDFRSTEDVKKHMEDIKIHLRGHNLFDIFYGRYRKKENALLRRYIELAHREEFADILDAVDSFIYFKSKQALAKESE